MRYIIRILSRVFYIVINFIKFKVFNRKSLNIKTKVSNFKGSPYVLNKGRLTVGVGVKINSGKNYNVIGGDVRSNFIIGHNAEIIIGKNSGLSNTTIVAHRKVTIGERVKIGGGVKIYDTDFHNVCHKLRANPKTDNPLSSPISISDDVFIGAHSTILKGVSIGIGSIVGASSVVTKNIPSGEIWAGNPAKCVRKNI
jgi:acetyltransferase-like isoleucine patch superfamily enzyme